MLLIGVVIVVLVVRVGRRLVRAPGDLAEAVIDLSAARLTSTRPEWATAMSAELAYLEARPTRLRFALGCARAALVPPLAEAPARGARLAVVAAAMAIVALGVLAQRRVEVATAVARHSAVHEFAAALLALTAVALHAWLVDRRAREASRRAAAARRSGVVAGVILGLLTLALLLPWPGIRSSALGSGIVTLPLFPLVPVGCLLAGAAAARASGDGASGREAGVWAGRVAGAIMAIGLLATTLWASGWFVHDAATISAYRDVLGAGYGTRFLTISGYVVGENLDTALICSLLTFPLVGLVFGALGGVVGSIGRRGHLRSASGRAGAAASEPVPDKDQGHEESRTAVEPRPAPPRTAAGAPC